MSDHVFVTAEQVRKTCRELGISDWSEKTDESVDKDEAEIVRKHVGADANDIPLEEFRAGLAVELEHGRIYPDANVTGNHPIATGLIVLAHLKEGLDYYARLECMELEMELDDALAGSDAERARDSRLKLSKARAALDERVRKRLEKE